MVVGNGLIAKAFEAYSDNSGVLVFASGVSDSKTNDPAQFEREKRLLERHIEDSPGVLMVYFSTCSVYDPSLNDNAYVQHKLAMEKLIQEKCDHYLIVRLPNVVGAASNAKTVFHFLADAIRRQQHFNLWRGSKRNFIDVADACEIVDELINNGTENAIVNVANPVNDDIYDLVRKMETYFGQQGNYTLQDMGSDYRIPIEAIMPVLKKKSRLFAGDYSLELLKKYYPIQA